jgi:formylglycine-generating enzyme required for sulfatase activity
MRPLPGILFFIGLGINLLTCAPLRAEVPRIVSYQGRIAVGTVNFDGQGQFRFALVDAGGNTVYWMNSADTSPADGAPDAAVSLAVTKGLYSVLLGDTTLTNMAALPASVFENADVRLRIWFDDGTNGSQLLTPDLRIAAAGYALVAGTLVDGAVTSGKIAPGAVGSAQLGSGLTLAGTTTGTFSGNLTGNASTATTAQSALGFSGNLAGDVTGPQTATAVASVGGVSAANVASGVNLANASVSANTAGTIVRRDANGDFAGEAISGKVFALPATTSGTSGVVLQGGARLIHSAGTENFFAGAGAGNLSLTGTGNVGIGFGALQDNLAGNNNTALGHAALENSTGSGNIAVGEGAGSLLGTGSNNLVIGHPGVADESDVIRIGTNQAHTYLAGVIHGDGSGLRNLQSAPDDVLPVRGMVWIKPGTFPMGSRTDEPGRGPNETLHSVTLTRGFWMGVHEVTQAEYLAVAGSNPSFFQSPADPNRPVESVTWTAAMAYCATLTASERAAGRIPQDWEYRLPTEAEWEYCARAGARTARFAHGDDLAASALPNYGWYSANAGGTTRPVEQKLGNPWGLMDMHGNVWEWCLDWFDGFTSASVVDPAGPPTGTHRVIRGGGWDSGADLTRSASRDFEAPNTGYSLIGFRIALAEVVAQP